MVTPQSCRIREVGATAHQPAASGDGVATMA
jgi:hypothetical protein